MMRTLLILTALVFAAPMAHAQSPEGKRDGIYQIVKATDSRVWRLNTETGEIAVCSLDGENLVCTTTSDAADVPKKSYEQIAAERKAEEQARQAEYQAQQERELKIIDKILALFRELLATAMGKSEGGRPPCHLCFDFQSLRHYHYPAFIFFVCLAGIGVMTDKKKALAAVREEIDAIDQQIQDLLIRRTEVVEKVRAIKEGETVKIRPSREAEMMYHITARHRGNFPKRELCRIWREIIVATLSFEGPFSVAVMDVENEPGYWDMARDQYGSFSKMTRFSSGRAVVEAVRSQEASVGIVPWPSRDDPDPWWRYMVSQSPDTPKVIARLPFVPGSNMRGSGIEAAVICPIEQERTGRDRSMLAVETDTEIGARKIEDALNSAGVSSSFIQNWHDPNRPPGWMYLVEAFGFVDPAGKQFPRFIDAIGKSAQRIIHLGGYGTPLGERDVAPPEGDD